MIEYDLDFVDIIPQINIIFKQIIQKNILTVQESQNYGALIHIL